MGIRTVNLFLLLLVSAVLLSGCGTLETRADKGPREPLAMADKLLSESALLDVWIQVFKAAPLPEDEDESRGINLEIRKAESRYMAVHLKNTLQRTGYWGAVRVVPENANAGEILVTGEIMASDGETLALHIQARDSRGKTWLDKTYEGSVEDDDYGHAVGDDEEPFQNIYNAIANDLARHKGELTPKSLTDVRRVAEMRFAAELAPDVFADYLAAPDGGYAVNRLPAEQDPMLARIRHIRERDYLLIDTVNDHYDGYYRDLQDSYYNWRKFRREETENLRRVERQATLRKVLGIGLIVGAVALEMFAGVSARATTAGLRSSMLLGGLYATKSGFDKAAEAQIHIDAIEELGTSFESEAAPMVVELDGETHRLTGSAEAQYAEWRSLLHRIHAADVGLPASAH